MSGGSDYQYDPAGNLIEEINANGLLTSYSYDALNRLTGVDYAGDSLNVAWIPAKNMPE